jgi:hypothetical protein
LGDLGAVGCGGSGVRRFTDEMRLRTLEKRPLDSDDGAGLLLIEAADDSDDDPTEKRLDSRLPVFFFSPSIVRPLVCYGDTWHREPWRGVGAGMVKGRGHSEQQHKSPCRQGVRLEAAVYNAGRAQSLVKKTS